MTCRICSGRTALLFKETVLSRHLVRYERCEECGFVCTEEPYWLDEAYARPINLCDTGIIARNEKFRDALAFLLYIRFRKGGSYLDYAGGYGLLTRMMRDCGFDFHWCDPYTKNLFAEGFEMQDSQVPYTALTCCECYEHFVDPVKELGKQLQLSRNIFLTTTLLPMDPPAPSEWDYYGFSHGQHVSFYTLKALKALADRFGLEMASNTRQFHFLGDVPPSDGMMRLAFSPMVRLTTFIIRLLNGSLMQADHDHLKGDKG